MNKEFKDELVKVYSELMNYLDSGVVQSSEKDVILENLWNLRDELKKECNIMEEFKLDEKNKTIEFLQKKIIELERELKVTKEDRDESKMGLQHMIAKYYEINEKLKETIKIYEKLYFSYTHEYCFDKDAKDNMFTGTDYKRMEALKETI